jgi:hypothetical protein
MRGTAQQSAVSSKYRFCPTNVQVTSVSSGYSQVIQLTSTHLDTQHPLRSQPEFTGLEHSWDKVAAGEARPLC